MTPTYVFVHGHVVDIVRQVRAHGPVILVGHSLGGLAISGAGNEIPDLIDRLVYIAAICPVRPATRSPRTTHGIRVRSRAATAVS